MKHYDKLMDSISAEIYSVWEKDTWDEGVAKEKSYAILKKVEEFQQDRVDFRKQWRASD
tara:strand:- start:661 stop:837 length:177 start_codon:yes stop_codon:yes gene_type:complete